MGDDGRMSADRGSRARRVDGSALAAAGSALMCAVLYALAVGSAAGRRLDVEVVTDAFYNAELRSSASMLVDVTDAAVWIAAAAALTALALARHGRRTTLTLGVMLAGGLGSPRILKTVLEQSDPLHGEAARALGAGFFPSGHAAAAMALTLAAVVLAARHGRSAAAAAVGGACAALVGVAHVLELSHHPTDVLGGYLLAAVWALVAQAAFGEHDAPDAAPPGVRAAAPAVLTAGVVAVAAVAILAVSDARPQLTLGTAAVAAAAFAVAGACAALLPARRVLR